MSSNVRTCTQESRTSLPAVYRPRLHFIHHQLQLRHDVPHHDQRFFRSAAAADHQIIRIVNDVCSQTLLVPELLPSQHETTHVQVAEQRADPSSRLRVL